MSTKIEWTDETWNPVTGCTKVSTGCDHCYAEIMHERFNGKGSFATVTLHPARLDKPLRWRTPKRVFVNSMSDLFHDDVPDEYIARVWAVMAATPQHTYQVLTKRHGRMRSLLSSLEFDLAVAAAWSALDTTAGSLTEDHTPPYPLPNVWLGVSAENQRWANTRINALLNTPAAVRFVSCEPLLGPIEYDEFPVVDWVIVGGESGHGARPMHPDWARSLRDQCADAGVAFHFKQWGEYRHLDKSNDYVWTEGGDRLEPVRVGKKAAGRELDGRTWDEYPEVVA